MNYIIGVDLGGTNIKTALVNSRGKIIKNVQIPTEAKKGSKVILDNIIKSINEVKIKPIKAIGIGCPGSLDLKKGTIVKTPNMPFRNYPIREKLRQKLRVPVMMDNDANCFVLAEAKLGKGKKHNVVIGLTLGTGFGCGLVINKQLYHGKESGAEIGHATINFNGPKCHCGRKGCLEAYIASYGISARANGKTPLQVQELAEKGNKQALKVYKDTGKFLGQGLTDIINAYDPDIIILGGKISRAWKLFHKTMNIDLVFNKKAKVVKSSLKNAGILGAASLALE